MAEKLVQVRLKAITDDYKREMNEAANVSKRWSDDFTVSADKVGKKMQRVGAGLTAGVTLPLLALGKEAVNAASDLQEADNVAGLVFGDMRAEIDAAADSSVELAGLSKRAYYEAASSVGGLLDNLGFGREETVKWSQDLVTLAADMGSAFNTSTEDAIQAIGAGLRGESEPLKRFNVFLSETELATRAVEMGLAATTSEVDRNAKAQAALSAITEQTATVQGDWANTQDETAGSLKKARAEFENATAALGEGLLPVVADAAGFLSDLLSRFNELPGSMQENIVKFGGLAAAAGPLTVAAGTVLRNFESIKGVLGSRTTGLIGGTFLAATAMGYLAGEIAEITGIADADLSGLAREVDRLLSAGNSQGIDELVGGIDGIASALDRIADPSGYQSVTGAFNQSLDKVKGLVSFGNLPTTGWSDARRELAAMDDVLADLVSSGNGEQAAELMGMINEAAEQQGVDLATVSNVFPNYTREVEIAGAANNEAADDVEDHGEAQGTLEDATRKATDALKKQHDELRAQADPVFALQRSMESLKGAQDDYNTAVEEYGPASDEAKRAAGELGTAVLDARGAALEAQDSMGPAFRQKLQALAREMDLTEPQVEALMGLVGELAGVSDQYSGSYHADYTADTAEAREQLEALIGTMSRLNEAGRHVAVPGTNLGGRTAFHSGGVVTPGSLTRLPGMAPDEGLAKLQYGEVVMSRADVASGRSTTSIGSQMTVAEGAIQIVTADAAGAAGETGWTLRKLAYR